MFSLCFLKFSLFASTLFGAGIDMPVVCDNDPVIPIIIIQDKSDTTGSGRPKSLPMETVSASYAQNMLYVSIANYSGLAIVTVEGNLGNVVVELQQIVNIADKIKPILIPLNSIASGDYIVKIRTGAVYWGRISL